MDRKNVSGAREKERASFLLLILIGTAINNERVRSLLCLSVALLRCRQLQTAKKKVD
jgi:hypothetical protein